MSRRLSRSENNKVLAGVCGGIAEYVQTDPLLIRLAFIVLAVTQFTLGLILYAVAALVMPVGAKESGEAEVVDHPHENTTDTRRLLALILIGLGAFLLFFNLAHKIPLLAGYLALFRGSLWPLALIILGIIFLLRQGSKN